MKAVIVVAGLFLAWVAPAFAEERLACHDEYANAYNLSMDSMDAPDDNQKATQAVQAQNNFDACLNSYESQHGKQAREDLSLKLGALEP